MVDDSAPGRFSHHFSNARNVRFYGPTTFSTVGGNIGISNHHSVAELRVRLRPIFDATHDAGNRKICTRGTRKLMLRSITTWADSEVGPNNHLFVLTGCVGSGKTTVSQTVSVHFQQGSRLGGSWFFSKQSGNRSKMEYCVATLASQLATAVPGTAPYIKDALRSQSQLLDTTTYTHSQTSLFDQLLLSLLLKPFKIACERGEVPNRRLPIIIVVDALDECGETSQVQVFLTTILDFFQEHPTLPLRFFLATRMEPHIERTYSKKEVVQNDLDSHGSQEEMDIFFKESFSQEVLNRNRVIQAFVKQYGAWPNPHQLRSLSNHTKGSFLLAARMVHYILDSADDNLTPIERLPRALKMELNLDELYMQTFSQNQNLPGFSDIISAIALLNIPLSISALAKFLGIPTYKVVHVLQGMQSVIEAPPDDSKPVRFCHASLRAFCRTEHRSREFYVSPAHHLQLAYCCFLQNVRCGPMSSPHERTPANAYSIANCTVHWHSFLEECEEDIASEIESFSKGKGPASESEGVSRHAFLSTLFVWQLFHLGSGVDEPRQLQALPPSILSYIFTEWTRQLTLAVREGPDPVITAWLNQPVGQLIQCSAFWGRRSFVLSQDAFKTFQANIQSASFVAGKKLSVNGAPPPKKPGVLSDVSLAKVRGAFDFDDGISKTLSPMMVLLALESIGSRCHRAEDTDENGQITLEFGVILNFHFIEAPILVELFDELTDDCEEYREEVDCFLESQPDPHNYASYHFPDRTLYIR